MNRRLITYNYLKTIANGSIHFHAFSYQYPGSGYGQQPVIVMITGCCLFYIQLRVSPPPFPGRPFQENAVVSFYRPNYLRDVFGRRSDGYGIFLSYGSYLSYFSIVTLRPRAKKSEAPPPRRGPRH